MTSTSGSASSSRNASTICGTALGPCTAVLRTANRTAGQRSVATEMTSCSAADARPVIRPMVLRQERDRPLEPRVEQALGVEQSAQPLDAGQQFADADRANLADAQAE